MTLVERRRPLGIQAADLEETFAGSPGPSGQGAQLAGIDRISLVLAQRVLDLVKPAP
jgi:hypothetical protein